MVELADLIALRQVGVEVILAVEGRAQVDRGVQAEPGAHRLLDAERVDHGQRARHRRVHEGDVRVGLGAEGGAGAGEEFGERGHLRVDLEADDELPVLPRPLDHLGSGGGIGQVEHGEASWGSVADRLVPGAARGKGGAKRAGPRVPGRTPGTGDGPCRMPHSSRAPPRGSGARSRGFTPRVAAT